MVSSKKIDESTIAKNVLKHGVGGLNIESCKVFDNSKDVVGRYPNNLILSCDVNCKGDNHSPDCPVTVISKNRDVILESDVAKFFKQLPFDIETINSIYYQAKASANDKSNDGKVKNIHPTVKSRYLMIYLITLITPNNGIVLDPFCGSGTTAVACKELGRNYICIEKEKEYFDIACDRNNQTREYSKTELKIKGLKETEQLNILDLI